MTDVSDRSRRTDGRFAAEPHSPAEVTLSPLAEKRERRERTRVEAEAFLAEHPTARGRAGELRAGAVVDLEVNHDDGPFTFAFAHSPEKYRAWRDAGASPIARVTDVHSGESDEPDDIVVTLAFGESEHDFSLHRGRTLWVSHPDA